MDDIRTRLTRCFEVVFPDSSAEQIQTATQLNTEAWDSIAAITLFNVIEEEFNLQLDFEVVGDLTSFQLILDYVSSLQALP
jgi:acyl carrier protein